MRFWLTLRRLLASSVKADIASAIDEDEHIGDLPTLTSSLEESPDDSIGLTKTASEDDSVGSLDHDLAQGTDDEGAWEGDDLDVDGLFDLGSLDDSSDGDLFSSLSQDAAQLPEAQTSATDTFFERKRI